jgi:hypothetical protein
MSFPGTTSRVKAVRQLAEQARALASAGDWPAAIEVNKKLIERSPRDVDALNRLGKACFELEQYGLAYDAYQRAAEADPANIISRRNLERLEPLRDFEADEVLSVESSPPGRAGVYIEEAGSTYVDEVVDPAPTAYLRMLSSGEKLTIKIENDQAHLIDINNEYVGKLEPRIGRRLASLINLGNKYDAYITANAGDSIRVIIRETEKSPEMGDRVSFPDQGKVSKPRTYLRDSRLFRGDEEISLIMGTTEDEELEEDDLDIDAHDIDVDDDEEDDEEFIVDDDDEEDLE